MAPNKDRVRRYIISFLVLSIFLAVLLVVLKPMPSNPPVSNREIKPGNGTVTVSSSPASPSATTQSPSVERKVYAYKKFKYSYIRSYRFREFHGGCLGDRGYTISCYEQFLTIVSEILSYHNISVDPGNGRVHIAAIEFNGAVVDHVWMWSYMEGPGRGITISYEALYGIPVYLAIPLHRSDLKDTATEILENASALGERLLQQTTGFNASQGSAISLESLVNWTQMTTILGVNPGKYLGDLRPIYIFPGEDEVEIYCNIYINGYPVFDPVVILSMLPKYKAASFRIERENENGLVAVFELYTIPADPGTAEGFSCSISLDDLRHQLEKMVKGLEYCKLVVANTTRIYYIRVVDGIPVYRPGYLVDVVAYTEDYSKVFSMKVVVDGIDCTVYDYSGYMEEVKG